MSGNPSVEIKITADGDQAKSVLGQVAAAEAKVGATGTKAGVEGAAGLDQLAVAADPAAESVGGIVAQLAALASAAALTALVGALESAGMRAQDLRSRLDFATGGGADSDQVMRGLAQTAGDLVLKVGDLTNTYIRLKNLGLDPSREALTAYANVAAANGKSSIDFAEAVADAITGEFERLKEFGLKAAVQGDQVALRFKGQTVMMANDAASIEAALIKIGNTEFAGTAAATAGNASVALDRMADSVDRLAGKLAQDSGLIAGTSAFATSVSKLADALSAEAVPAQDAAAASMDAMKRSYLEGGQAMPGIADILLKIPGALVEGWRNAIDWATYYERKSKGLIGGARELADATQAVADAQSGAAAAAKAETEQQKMLADQVAGMPAKYQSLAEAKDAARQSALTMAEALADEQARRQAQSRSDASIDAAQAAMTVTRSAVAAEAAQRAADADRGNITLSRAAAEAHRAALEALVAKDQEAAGAAAQAYRQRQVEQAQAEGALALLDRETAKVDDLKKAKDLVAKAKIATDQAALTAEQKALDVVANAAQRAASALDGVRSAEQSLQQAQAQAAGQGPSANWANASSAAGTARDQLRAQDFTGAAKTIQDGMATLQRAVAAGGPAALIDATRRELHDLSVEAEAAIKQAQAAARTAQTALKTDPKTDSKTASKTDPKTGDSPATATAQAVRDALAKPIPLTFDVAAGAAAAGQQVVAAIQAALAGAAFSVPVRAIVTVDAGGATPTAGADAAAQAVSTAAAKTGTRPTP